MFSDGRLVADVMMLMITHSLLLYKSEIEDTWERISNYVFAWSQFDRLSSVYYSY